MIKHLGLAAIFLILGCAAALDKDETLKKRDPVDVNVSSEEENRVPKNIPPRPARTTCPQGMMGSC